MIDAGHEGLPALLLDLAEGLQEVVLQLTLRLQVLQQDSGLGEAFVGPIEAGNHPAGGPQQDAGVVAGQGQAEAGGLAVEAGGEGTRAGKHREPASPLPLPP